MRTIQNWNESVKDRVANKLFPTRIVKELNALNLKPTLGVDFKKGAGYYLYGDTGVGKTLYAAAIMLQTYEELWLRNENEKYSFDFISTPKLLFEIKQTFGKPSLDGQTAEEFLLKKYVNTDLLILDDFGISAKVSDWTLNTLYLIVNERWENMRPTIYTSNLTLEEITDIYDSRISSRITRQGAVIKKTHWQPQS